MEQEPISQDFESEGEEDFSEEEGYANEREEPEEPYAAPNAGGESSILNNNEPNAGFVPLEQDTLSEKQRQELLKQRQENETKKRKRSEYEIRHEEYWRDELNRLICDYPGEYTFQLFKNNPHIDYCHAWTFMNFALSKTQCQI